MVGGLSVDTRDTLLRPGPLPCRPQFWFGRDGAEYVLWWKSTPGSCVEGREVSLRKQTDQFSELLVMGQGGANGSCKIRNTSGISGRESGS